MDTAMYVGNWIAIGAAGLTVLGMVFGFIKWLFAIHKIGQDLLAQVQELVMSDTRLKRGHRIIKTKVANHDKILDVHGKLLDNHATRVSILEGTQKQP